jgi:CheY-like chemotaxis protein
MSAPSAQPTRVLVVVADSGLQNTFEVLLSEGGYEPHVVATLDEALARVDETPLYLDSGRC